MSYFFGLLFASARVGWLVFLFFSPRDSCPELNITMPFHHLRARGILFGCLTLLVKVRFL